MKKSKYLFFLALCIGLQLTCASASAESLGQTSSCAFDLSSALRAPHQQLDREMVISTLDADTAKAILARANGQGNALKELAAGELYEEHARIAAAGHGVARVKKMLTVTPTAGPTWCFVDYQVAELPGMDGDASTFIFGGRFGKSAYLRVNEDMGHDSPYAHLVDSRSGKELSFHVGSDDAALSPDGMRLVVLQPTGFAIARLDREPGAEIACAMPILPYDDARKLTLEFKGWQGAEEFSAVLQPKAKGQAPIALRVKRQDGKWQIAANDSAALRKAGALRCSENVALPPPGSGKVCRSGCDEVMVKNIAPALTLFKPLRQMFSLSLQAGGHGRDTEIAAAKREIEAYETRPGHGDQKAARTLNEQGLSALRSGEPAKAAKRFVAAHSLDPADVEVLNNLGYAEFLAGAPDAGLHLVSALILDPGRVNAWVNLGQLFARGQATSEAVACFSLALRFATKPAKTLQYLRDLAAKGNEASLTSAVEQLAGLPWVKRLSL